MKYRCPVCGYIHEGSGAPDKCPQCGAPGEKFSLVNEDAMVWAAEHVIGVEVQIQRIIEGLRLNFTGECTEVGMYLAMSRAADRQGLPEVAGHTSALRSRKQNTRRASQKCLARSYPLIAKKI